MRADQRVKPMHGEMGSERKAVGLVCSAPFLAMACVRWPDATAHHLKELIVRDGQPALDITILDDDGWEGLLAVVATPLDGWRHLVQDAAECIAAYGPYHMSICQSSMASAEDIAALRAKFAGVETTLPILAVSGEGCLELAECELTRCDIVRKLHFHERAWYRERPFHISG